MIQLSNNDLGKAKEGGPNIWIPSTHIEEQEDTSGLNEELGIEDLMS